MIQLSSKGGDIAWLVNRVDELGQRTGHMASDEIRAQSRSIMDRRQVGDESPELLAMALAASREALRRTTGGWPASAVIGAVATAISGVVAPVHVRKDRQAALAMALYWHSLAGKGVHLVLWDERSARGALKLFDPVGVLLGCDARLVTRSMTGAARRSAYGAMVTFGSYSEMAADYLRDNLHDSRADVVQRELYAAVVDDVDSALVPRALSQVLITAPRVGSPEERPDIVGIAASFRRGFEYRLDRKQRAIVFTAPAMSRLKSAVGWGDVPSLKAVTMAECVEHAIVRRESLVRMGEYETLVDISVQGYLGAYEGLTGFSSRGQLCGSIDDILREAGKATRHYSRELIFERVIDRQRSKIYDYRAKVRDESETLSFIRPIVFDTVQAWLIRGVDTLIAGLYDALAGHRTPEQIGDALYGSASPSDFADRATLTIEKAIEWRGNALGAPQMAALLRKVLLTLLDIQWREHLIRIRFLQRQSGALYDLAADVVEAREADVSVLFAACEQAIRVESIKYMLNVRL